MRKVKRWRYYCDYCKKAGGSSGHMKSHEKGCTLNPNRECGVCGMIEDADQKPIAELIAVLPDPSKYLWDEDDRNLGFLEELTGASNNALKELRTLTENCPACIMAALRQAGIPVPMVTDYDWAKEMESIWHDINLENEERYSYQ